MSVKLSITVSDIAGTLGSGYTHIRVYRSTKKTTGFKLITTVDSEVLLQAGVSSYEFIDYRGTPSHWYKTAFYGDTPGEGTKSNAFQGTFVDTNFSGASYPPESYFTNDEHYILGRVRNLIGDNKELTRDYLSSVAGGYDNVAQDGYSYEMTNPKGWPLEVTLDGSSYTDISNPEVRDYKFLTFSGTQINTTSGTLDVWYYHFRHSDSEILQAYNSLKAPPGLKPEQVTSELRVVCTAYDLLSSELRLFGATSATEIDIYQEIRINPKVGMDGRIRDLEALRNEKYRLIDEIKADAAYNDIDGFLID